MSCWISKDAWAASVATATERRNQESLIREIKPAVSTPTGDLGEVGCGTSAVQHQILRTLDDRAAHTCLEATGCVPKEIIRMHRRGMAARTMEVTSREIDQRGTYLHYPLSGALSSEAYEAPEALGLIAQDDVMDGTDVAILR